MELIEELFNSPAVGRRIRALRERRGMSQKELSILSRIPQWQLSRIEKGTRPIRPPVLTAIAQALDVTVDELLQDLKEAPRGPKPTT